MGYVGWAELPGKYVRVGCDHDVVTDRGIERMRCASAGDDARFSTDDFRVVIVPREKWSERILDLADDQEVEQWRKR